MPGYQPPKNPQFEGTQVALYMPKGYIDLLDKLREQWEEKTFSRRTVYRRAPAPRSKLVIEGIEITLALHLERLFKKNHALAEAIRAEVAPELMEAINSRFELVYTELTYNDPNQKT